MKPLNTQNTKFIWISTILLFVFTSCLGQKFENRGYIVNVGDTVPEITLQLTDGTQLNLEELRGKIVVLQFTASWCGVCRREMPHLEKEVWQRFKDDGFLLIGVDYDEPLEKVVKFQKDIGTTYPMALDPNADIFALFAHKKAGVTRNVVIDQSGKIAFLTRLFNREEFDGMVGKIEELLKE